MNKILALLAATFVPGLAAAATGDVHVIDYGKIAAGSTLLEFGSVAADAPGTPFTDVWSFQIEVPTHAQVAISDWVPDGYAGVLGLAQLRAQLFSGVHGASGGPDAPYALRELYNLSPVDVLGECTLPAGNYFFVVQGVTSGSAGAMYAWYVESAAAVPEPESWVTMLAGLGLAGSFARRRRAA